MRRWRASGPGSTRSRAWGRGPTRRLSSVRPTRASSGKPQPSSSRQRQPSSGRRQQPWPARRSPSPATASQPSRQVPAWTPRRPRGACRCGAPDATSAGCRERPARRSCQRPRVKNSAPGGGSAWRRRGTRGQDRNRRVTLAVRRARSVPSGKATLRPRLRRKTKSRDDVFRRITSGPSGYSAHTGRAIASEGQRSAETSLTAHANATTFSQHDFSGLSSARHPLA